MTSGKTRSQVGTSVTISAVIPVDRDVRGAKSSSPGGGLINHEAVSTTSPPRTLAEVLAPRTQRRGRRSRSSKSMAVKSRDAG